MTLLADRARALLPRPEAGAPLEMLWRGAALRTLATGQHEDPELDELRRLTAPSEAWAGIAPWPVEAIQDRIARLVDSHRLAIALGDDAWLAELARTWTSAPQVAGEAWPVRALGEIGLALGAAGGRPSGWTEDELELLTEEGFLLASPADRAWRALAEGHLDEARLALAEHRARMIEVRRGWENVSEEGLRQLLVHPATVLDIEPRAVEALLARRAPPTSHA